MYIGPFSTKKATFLLAFYNRVNAKTFKCTHGEKIIIIVYHFIKFLLSSFKMILSKLWFYQNDFMKFQNDLDHTPISVFHYYSIFCEKS